ncbi:MAG TPA: Ni/Fe hydrogenase subunit alpha, partial [Candidatus Bathyarchaeia archaeon]|nr:Ni/Fe hydrogenase subunit alpha [Candidatus Bathyarchaeia archaeon]
MKKITIDPVTRLEGHGKIEIFLDDAGNVQNAYLQVPELRGFEKFCIGRKAEEMPQLTTRICGVCPVAHHMASAKALDQAFGVEAPPAAKRLRELMFNAYYIYDHILHFYFLGGPDFIVGPKAPASDRNVIGVINKLGLEIGKDVIKHRAYGQKITAIIGGKATHPVCALPGGMSKPITDKEQQEIEEMAESCVEFAKLSLGVFEKVVLGNEEFMKLIKSNAYNLETYYMGMVDEKNKVNFYDGKIRVVNQSGKEYLRFNPGDYFDVVEERVEEWTYSKLPYLKNVGWRGYVDGSESGIYRVGPLARLNASESMATPLAQQEYLRMYETLGGKPLHSTLAYHWARLVELLYAAERTLELSRDPEITSTDIRRFPTKSGEGVGVVEAARGTLIHHYKLDEEGLIKDVNLIVATTNNYPAICTSVKTA